MQWKLSDDRPIYVQLMETITAAIASGTLAAGSRLPSVREMAAQAGVNPNTMQRALAELERDGLLYSQRTAGRFVTTNDVALHALRKANAQAAVDAYISACRALGVEREQAHSLIDERWDADT